MRDRFGASNPRSMMMRFHVQTGGSTLTAQQPDVNVVRVSLQALAAVLGGAQSLHTNGKDEALALPTEESARLALRTQQIIAHESGVTNTADPLGGSYYIEQLTDEIERAARDYIARIDTMGGTLAAIENNFIQNEIQNAAYEYQQAVERGDAIVVGVNGFKQQEQELAGTFRLDPELERQQIARLRDLRASRSASALEERLAALEQAARSTDNLMSHIIACAETMGTVGEISDRLRKVFGEYTER
jgi:methylmalonyl-CoA mutase N-terminal domain/subunit